MRQVSGGVKWHYDEYDARASPFTNRGENPEKALLMRECLEYILRVSHALPKRQAEVWILTDLFEWTAEEVSTALAISPENQRVLLHRAHHDWPVMSAYRSCDL
jgi:DNA-directed RNA polymerase specialized sigma24 family protein